MIRFLSKGLMRDRTRSFFPLIVISLTVAIVVFGSGFMRGVMNSMLLDTAVMLTGHEKIVTRAYNEESELIGYKTLHNEKCQYGAIRRRLFDVKNTVL